MGVNSAINNLVGTFTETEPGNVPADTTSCICFDTSTNKIGINTISPAYAIEVKESDSNIPESGTIKTDYLILKDTVNDKYYKIRIIDGQLNLESI